MTMLVGGVPNRWAVPLPKRDLAQAMKRGALGHCPSCGEGHVFDGYLTVRAACEVCGEELHHHRADDAPPYFTIVILGHIIIGIVLGVEVAYAPPLWVHMALWIPITIVSALAMLRPVKGALVGLQWALYMHGFDPNAIDEQALMIGETGDAHGGG